MTRRPLVGRFAIIAIALTGLLLTVVGVPATATSAAHQQAATGDDPTPPTAAKISILSQSSWVAPNGSFELALGIEGTSPTDRLDLAVFPRVTRQAQFDESIRAENLGRPLTSDIHAFDVSAYPSTSAPVGATGLLASIPVAVDQTPPFGIQLTQPGVYPVRITVTDEAGNQRALVVTHLLRLPSGDSATPLGFSMIVPVHAPPARQPDGTTVIDQASLTRIDAALGAIARHPAVPLTFAPTPETIDGLAAVERSTGDEAARRDRVTTFSTAAKPRQILGQSYVDLDLSAWVAAPPPADAELNQQLLSGAEAIAARIGVRPDTRTILTNRTVSAETLTRFRFTGTNRLVVPETQLAPLTGSSSAAPYQAFAVTDASGESISAISTSEALERRLSETSDPVLNGHLVLADLAFTWATTGTAARGTVLAVPADLDVPTETYDAILDGLAERSSEGGDAMVSAVTVDDLFRITGVATGRSGATLIRDYRADDPGSIGTLATRAASTRAQVSSYRSMVRTEPSRADNLDLQVLVAQAAGLSDDQRDAYLNGATAFMDAQFAGIVAPDNQRVTLTAENGELPITVENALDYPVDVEVSIASVKLEFPEGNTRRVTLAPASSTRVALPVSARASGAFPVDVSVRTPDEQVLIASARFTVRSTAISGIGLIISISAGAFLLLWWALHFRRTRRAKRLVDSNHPALR